MAFGCGFSHPQGIPVTMNEFQPTGYLTGSHLFSQSLASPGQPSQDTMQTVCPPGSSPPCTHAPSQNRPPGALQTIFSLVPSGSPFFLPRKEDNRHNGSLVLNVTLETKLPELPASSRLRPAPGPVTGGSGLCPACLLRPPEQRQRGAGGSCGFLWEARAHSDMSLRGVIA